ncbi:MAG: T9SS type A sorting domain-containing protein, partial [Flavobacteriales bacterium]|nr:T9SS type A sorting domain-containing protein [Flavobacteriales bacterium]
SEYERDQLDNRIKITNLPEECTISIYNINGTLMRRFKKADPKTSLDWELTNQVDVPIASGVYLIHIKVPNIGERTLKWFGVMKPTDLNGFN